MYPKKLICIQAIVKKYVSGKEIAKSVNEKELLYCSQTKNFGSYIYIVLVNVRNFKDQGENYIIIHSKKLSRDNQQKWIMGYHLQTDSFRLFYNTKCQKRVQQQLQFQWKNILIRQFYNLLIQYKNIPRFEKPQKNNLYMSLKEYWGNFQQIHTLLRKFLKK